LTKLLGLFLFVLLPAVDDLRGFFFTGSKIRENPGKKPSESLTSFECQLARFIHLSRFSKNVLNAAMSTFIRFQRIMSLKTSPHPL
jgi:hypothetical protein